MCGIAGFIGQNRPSDKALHSTLKQMRNRGPDHQHWTTFNHGQNHCVLLHSRLAIIDLDSRSNQPFTIGDSTIVFNGEIYNYLELKAELVAQGETFQTESDTEVLLKLYRRDGRRCVGKLEGMWSFAVYNSTDGSLFLSRDRFAEKPLYFARVGGDFYFGSETKFLASLRERPPTVNRKHVLRHLLNGYKSLYKSNESYYHEVEELKYAENMLISADGSLERWRYWNPEFGVDSNMSLSDAIEGTRHHLLESVRIRLRSDVPLAFCLSGGVDSAALVSIAAKQFNATLETFSVIDSDPRYDERDNILATVIDVGCPHNLIEISTDGSLDRLQRLIEYHDAPIATISYLVHSMISQTLSEKGYKVTFSGTSADELFTGYYDHFILHLNEMHGRDDYGQYLADWQQHIGKFIRNPDLKNPNLYQEDPNYRQHVFDASEEISPFLTQDFTEEFTETRFTDNLLRNRMLNELFHEATPLILHEDDLNSMFYSVENRSPYLDTRLMKFAYSIPPEHLIRNGYGKYVLRMALEGILNDQVRLDRRKKGFNASIHSLVDFQDAETKERLLNSDAEIFQFVDRDAIVDLMSQATLPNHFSKFLFNFINAKMFLELN